MCISIHALREEGDNQRGETASLRSYFYPRPPRGGRPSSSSTATSYLVFLSTPSARRATRIGPPRASPEPFLSTPSARRATADVLQQLGIHPISIHALREEGDSRAARTDGILHDFYPRPPRGGRRCPASSNCRPTSFLSTPSARRATPPRPSP